MFDPSAPSTTKILDLVHTEMNKHHKLLYNSDDNIISTSYLGPNCVFMSKLHDRQVPTVIDTGASRSLSPFRSDFINFHDQKSSISGIGSDSIVEGSGLVRWKIVDQQGNIQYIETMAYYVPSAKIRLYSPQTHFKEQKNGRLVLDSTSCTLHLPHQDISLSFPFNQFNNLPLMIQAPSDSSGASALLLEPQLDTPYFDPSPHDIPNSTYHVDSADSSDPYQPHFFPDMSSSDIHSALHLEHGGFCAVTDEKNANLQSSQLELLAWHHKFGHIGMASLQRLMHPTKTLDNESTDAQLSHPIIIPKSQSVPMRLGSPLPGDFLISVELDQSSPHSF